MERVVEPRERRAGAQEVRPHRQDDRHPAPRRGRRVQQVGEERGPRSLEMRPRLVILRPVGEDLLELVDDDDQPRLRRRVAQRQAGEAGRARARLAVQVVGRASAPGRRRASPSAGRNARRPARPPGSPAGRPPAARSRPSTARSPSIAPALSRGISPASTTDDFPLPDGPSTARNRAPRVARTSRRRSLTSQPVRFSRPKKNRRVVRAERLQPAIGADALVQRARPAPSASGR